MESRSAAGPRGGPEARDLAASDLEAFDRVLAAWARGNPYGRLTVTASGGVVKDLHDEARVHLERAEKPSSALKRMLPGWSP